MNYEEAMQYIHAVQWAGHKPGLSRTRTLLAALGSPHKRLKFVHVAGTNGKGSTAAMLASCLRAAGYCVGLYTSPFINRFNERIQVDGEQIGDEELVRLVEKIRPAADGMADVPTEFEVITALGMLYFAEKQCDIVVLEVGLGGTLDSTNVIDPPECAVITALGMDHVKELGPTIADIASAKAGIIKPGSPVVSYGGVPEADAVIARVAAEQHAPWLEHSGKRHPHRSGNGELAGPVRAAAAFARLFAGWQPQCPRDAGHGAEPEGPLPRSELRFPAQHHGGQGCGRDAGLAAAAGKAVRDSGGPHPPRHARRDAGGAHPCARRHRRTGSVHRSGCGPRCGAGRQRPRLCAGDAVFFGRGTKGV